MFLTSFNYRNVTNIVVSAVSSSCLCVEYRGSVFNFRSDERSSHSLPRDFINELSDVFEKVDHAGGSLAWLSVW